MCDGPLLVRRRRLPHPFTTGGTSIPMNKRFWRDLVASPNHGLWQGAIPQPPTSPRGVKENAVFDAVMGLAKAEEDKERLGELLADAVERGQVRVQFTDEKQKRSGRPPNAIADSQMLHDIRVKNPKSDGWTIFRNRLTAPPDKGRQVSMTTARRRFRKAVSTLAQK